MIVEVYGDFNDFGRFWVAKNKANSKPNKANLNFNAENAELAELFADFS